jgi:hypothetical protein
MFDHRLIIPLLAKTIGVTGWLVPDPSDPTKTMPNPALASSYAGIWLGTIAKRLVHQALSWTGGNLPIVFQPDEADGNADHQRNYEGTDFKLVGDALKDLTNVDGGPDIMFPARFTEDLLGIEWLMQVGTVGRPQIHSDSVVRWNVTAPLSPVSGLKVTEDASKMASISWASAGRDADTVVVSRQIDDTLTDLGYPLMEVLDTSHTSVSEQPTLDKYARENLTAGQLPQETWSFDAEAYPVDEGGHPAGPQFGSYSVGDFCELDFQKWDPATGVGDIYVQEGGTKRMRIIGMSGDESGEKIAVKAAPIIGGGV